MFEDPWEELTFRNVGNQGRIFNAVEDRFLLCLTHLHGYARWPVLFFLHGPSLGWLSMWLACDLYSTYFHIFSFANVIDC